MVFTSFQCVVPAEWGIPQGEDAYALAGCTLADNVGNGVVIL